MRSLAVPGVVAMALLASIAVADTNDRCRITVGEIKAKADQCDDDLAAAIGEMLSTALANEDRFIVLANQSEVAGLASEIELADVVITGAVTSFEPNASGGGGLLGAAKSKVAGSVGVSSNTAVCGLDLKLIDIRTGRVIEAFDIEAKSTSWQAGGRVEDVALAGALGSYSNQPMEKAVRAVLVKAIDKVAKEVPKEYFRNQGGEQSAQDRASTSPRPESGGTPSSAEDMTLYTNYDFVPGDRVIFYEDFSGDETGEFPSRWRLAEGVVEIARRGDRPWLLITSRSRIIPDIENLELPEAFTLELELYDNGEPHKGHWYRLELMQGGDEAFVFHLGDHRDTRITVRGEEISAKELAKPLVKGKHTMRIMVTRNGIKCYVDSERVGNLPKPDGFAPEDIRVYLDLWDDPDNPMLMGAFRLAAGGKKLRDQLDQDGRIVTHGILFDSGSAVIKAESCKTLAEIGTLLTEDVSLRIAIEGHTDSDGADDANATLSQQRADAVKDYLVATFKVAADRLETRGLGESRPLDAGTSAEAKANNRRVELVKI